MDRFDPCRGLEFATYAAPTILGEIRRHFRDRTWAVHVHRHLQERTAEIARCAAHADPGAQPRAERRRAGRPGPGGPRKRSWRRWTALAAYTADSLDAPTAGDRTLGDRLGGEDQALVDVELHESLGPALATLPERERRILQLRFYGNRTQSQIAAELGISQMHVSRLLARTLRPAAGAAARLTGKAGRVASARRLYRSGQAGAPVGPRPLVAAGGRQTSRLVHEAPAPVLAGLERADHRVADRGPVPAGVPLRRGVAAADVAAGQAFTQVHPRRCPSARQSSQPSVVLGAGSGGSSATCGHSVTGLLLDRLTREPIAVPPWHHAGGGAGTLPRRPVLRAAPPRTTEGAAVQFEVLVLVAVAAAVAGLARRLKLSAPLLLVVAGIAASFVPGVGEYELEPDVVLFFILPPLLFGAAWQSSVINFRQNIRPIGLLSVGLVLFTTLAVGFAVHAVLPDLPLAAASPSARSSRRRTRSRPPRSAARSACRAG